MDTDSTFGTSYDTTVKHSSPRFITRVIKRILLLTCWFLAMFSVGLMLSDLLFR